MFDCECACEHMFESGYVIVSAYIRVYMVLHADAISFLVCVWRAHNVMCVCVWVCGCVCACSMNGYVFVCIIVLYVYVRVSMNNMRI